MSYLSVIQVLFSLLLSTWAVVVASTIPQTAQWSSKSYGPDGPWQAITISIGTPPQTVDLLPGGSWMTNVLAPSACVDEVLCNTAVQAGFYDSTESSTSIEIGQTGNINNDAFANVAGALPSLFGNANWTFDTMTIPILGGISTNVYQATVLDFDLLVITSAHETLPDGTTYPAQIGKLSLGAPNANQSWRHFPPSPHWNGTLLSSALFEKGVSPSNSYGMHIGSASMGIPGSLNFGGFDQSRAIGPVSSQAYNIDHLPIDLLDIGIGVAEGASPFNFTSRSGLLAEGNSSLAPATTVFVEAPVTYIYLPQSTCDAITQYLPVTYQSKYGLYFWNNADPNYKRIVSSPTFLSFTFRLNNSVSQNMTINVPFALLNLTLTAPIINTPTQYLPLRPGKGPSGSYELGRAFLQAAFVGVNWETADNTGDGVWFLAQAPGPNTPMQNPPTAIAVSDNSIVGSTNAWKDTWSGAWTVLESTNTSTGGTTIGGGSTGSTPKKGLSTGAIAGIAVGVVLGSLAAATVAFIFRRRHRAAKHSILSSSRTGNSAYRRSTFGPGELETRNYTGDPSPMINPQELASRSYRAEAIEMAG